ncbi:hypothetical protein [Natronorarus salvus]|uniref:hypothetical protein n=1 Tax=Natronorarus salvus TaxID=3117733 RepID=UPI002F26270D
MEEIPQPASEPYSEGDRVRVYLDIDDPDTRYDDLVCTVHRVFCDDLDRETGRELDSYSYQLRTDAGERLRVTFRHVDLIPETQ